MRTRAWIRSLTAVVALITSTGAASPGFVEFYDREEWEQAVGGDFTTIDFTGYPDNEILRDQYADLGVHFTNGNDSFYYNSNFINDKWGVDGNGDIVVEFDSDQWAIGFDHPGLLTIDLYRESQLIYESPSFPGGGVGFFAGVVASEPFDRAVIGDPLGEAAIDDMHFAVPSPGSAFLLALLFAGGGRRRERVVFH